MAVATPVLERTEITEEKENYGFSYRTREDEEHNARIKRNYAMLINPASKPDDVLADSVREEAPAHTVQVNSVAARQIFAERPYLVENARADAAIFRADSPVNRKIAEVQPLAEVRDVEEEENEDLRPTATTIQYKTNNVQNTVEEGKISNASAEKRSGLTKREKIVIAVVVSVIVALFALIIINSAIISGINSDISSLQSSLTDVKGTYAGISDEIQDYINSIGYNVEAFARLHGMTR